jgi:hypothetical protein
MSPPIEKMIVVAREALARKMIILFDERLIALIRPLSQDVPARQEIPKARCFLDPGDHVPPNIIFQ